MIGNGVESQTRVVACLILMAEVVSRLPHLRDACVPQSNQHADDRTNMLTALELLQRKHIGQIVCLETLKSASRSARWRRLSDEARTFRSCAVFWIWIAVSGWKSTTSWLFQRQRRTIWITLTSRKQTYTPSQANIAVPGVLVHFLYADTFYSTCTGESP